MVTVPSTASASKNWKVTSPPRRRRPTPLPETTSRSSKKKANTCAALCAGGVECSEPLPPAEGARWCPRHNEERRKLYSNYKTHDALIQGMRDIPPCHDVATIEGCNSLSVLREWNAHLRNKYNLLTRCIDARDYFTRRFFGEDMDFGHKTYWEYLKKQRSLVEQLMLRVEICGYQLILKDQNAMWVLEQDARESGDCSGYEKPPRGTDTTTIHSTDSIEGSTTEDPLEAILREKAMKLREKIRMYLAWYCAPLTSRFHAERLQVIYAYVRRAVYQDPSLMFLAHSYDSVMALLSDESLDIATVEKLWRAINALCTHGVQSAVDDAVRSTDGEHVVVLGGKVFKNTSGERWPLHAWGHLIAMRRCYSCLRRTCQTIDEVIDLTRYALLTGIPLSQKHLKYDFSVRGAKELFLAGFITDYIPLTIPRHSITSQEAAFNFWQESVSNLPLFAGLSLRDPMAQAFVNGCMRHPKFLVMLRKGANGRIIRSAPTICISRSREAGDRSVLASLPWNDTVLSDLALEEAQPSGSAHEKIADCMQVVVIDTGEGTMSDFIQKLVRIWCQVYKVDDRKQLYDVLKGPYEATGELEEYRKMTPEVARDYYQSLWGCEAPSVAEDLVSS